MGSSLSIKDSSGRQINLLNDHPQPIETPMEKRRYHCTEHGCHKSFTTSGHLARHHRIHTGEKNFQCFYPGCPSRFSRQDNMMQHYRTHVSPKSRRHQQHRRAMESASHSSAKYHHHPYYHGHSAMPTMPLPIRPSVGSMNYPPHLFRASPYPTAAMPYHLPSMVLPKPRGMMESHNRRSSSTSASSCSSVSSFPSPPANTATLLPPPHVLLGNSTSNHPLDQRKITPPSAGISDIAHFVTTFG